MIHYLIALAAKSPSIDAGVKTRNRLTTTINKAYARLGLKQHRPGRVMGGTTDMTTLVNMTPAAAAAIFVISLCVIALVFLLRPPKLDERRVIILCELMLAYMLLLGAGIGFSTVDGFGRIALGPLLMSFPLVYVWKNYGRRQ